MASRRPSSQRQYVPQQMPGFVDFQHPQLVDKPPEGERWIHEVKWDGYRLQLQVSGGRPTIYTRNGLDWTDGYPKIAAELAALPDCILDGELVALGPDGYSSFSGVRRAGAKNTGHLVVQVFDILWHGQDDMRRFALLDRKARVATLLASALGDRLRYVEPVPPQAVRRSSRRPVSSRGKASCPSVATRRIARAVGDLGEGEVPPGPGGGDRRLRARGWPGV